VTPLREIRAARLLSIRELAQLASVAPSTIYLAEAGRTVPRRQVVRRVAGALRVDPTEVDEFRLTIEAARARARRRRERVTGE
jgi:transcriptional regulator with XRE-family HTH domain